MTWAQVDDWLLARGAWDDYGIWEDSDVWIDGIWADDAASGGVWVPAGNASALWTEVGS